MLSCLYTNHCSGETENAHNIVLCKLPVATSLNNRHVITSLHQKAYEEEKQYLRRLKLKLKLNKLKLGLNA